MTSASAWWPWPNPVPSWPRRSSTASTREELAGHALGNLILAGLIDGTNDPVEALDEACRLLGVKGRVLPATTDPVVLKADADGGPVAGQVAVMATDNIRRVSLVPGDPAAPFPALEALERADQIVLGPGSLFTSVLAAIAVPEVREGINRSRATKIYVCNLRPQIPETECFDVAMHVEALVAHGVDVDVTVCDTSSLALGSPRFPVVDVPLARSQRDGPRLLQTGVDPRRSARMIP